MEKEYQASFKKGFKNVPHLLGVLQPQPHTAPAAAPAAPPPPPAACPAPHSQHTSRSPTAANPLPHTQTHKQRLQDHKSPGIPLVYKEEVTCHI
jgi:uncharacterized protein involved in copper resistance